MSAAIVKVREVWETIEVVAEELILGAETIEGLSTGEEKKVFVVGKLVELLKQLEAKHNFLPGALEGVTFSALGFALDFVVERLFRKLKVAGAL